MKKTTTLALAFGLVVAGGAFAQKLPPKPGATGSPVRMTRSANQEDHIIAAARRITRNDAEKLVKEGKAVYVDVRSKDTFDKGHIKGAISLPGSQIVSRMSEIPPGKMAITYCACVEEHTAAVAVVRLNRAGNRNVAALVGGWNEWIEKGLPIEKSK
jgi:rhodanese-related sulfurtransferase